MSTHDIETSANQTACTGAPVFHVRCALTGKQVCFCSNGVPAQFAAQDATKQFAKRSKELWEIWQAQQLDPNKPLAYQLPAKSAYVKLPPLVREVVREQDSELAEQRATAANQVNKLKRAVETAVVRAQDAAAAAGCEYEPPADAPTVEPRVTTARKVTLEEAERDFEEAQQAVQQQEQARVQAQEQQRAYLEAKRKADAAQKAHQRKVAEIRQRRQDAEAEMQRYQEHTREKRRATEAARRATQEWLAAEDKNDDEWEEELYTKAAPKQNKPKPANRGPPGGARPPPPTGKPPTVQELLGIRPGMSIGVGHFNTPHGGPPSQLLVRDVNEIEMGHWLWVFWDDDNNWWPAKVMGIVRRKPMTAILLYETGEEEPEVNLSELQQNNGIAWLQHPAVPDTLRAPGGTGGAAMPGQKRPGGPGSGPGRPAGGSKPKQMRQPWQLSEEEEEFLEEEEEEEEPQDDDDEDFDPRYADAKSPKPKKKKPKRAAPAPSNNSQPHSRSSQQQYPASYGHYAASAHHPHAHAMSALQTHAAYHAPQQYMPARSEVQQLLDMGHLAIGRKVQVYFAQLQQWLRASVLTLDPMNQAVQLRFDNGEVKKLPKQQEYQYFRLQL